MKKLNALIAEKVMRWQKKNMPLKGGPDENLCWTDGINYWPVDTYDPHRDMNYAMEALKAAFILNNADLGPDFNHYEIQYSGIYKQYFATCDVETENETLEMEAQADTPAMACCICALRACDVSETEISDALK